MTKFRFQALSYSTIHSINRDTLLHVIKEDEHKWLEYPLVQVLKSELNEMLCVCSLHLEGCGKNSFEGAAVQPGPSWMSIISLNKDGFMNIPDKWSRIIDSLTL